MDFKNTILIMTSNIGAATLLEGITPEGDIAPEAQKSVLEELKLHFRPEFLNRLDEVILFKPLTKENIGNIVTLIMADLNRRLQDKDIRVELSEEAKSYIIDNGYDPVYGARPLKRYIQKTVETLAAKLILADGVRSGETIMIQLAGDELVATAGNTGE